MDCEICHDDGRFCQDCADRAEDIRTDRLIEDMRLDR